MKTGRDRLLRHSAGASLIEVLVAIIVLSLGLLGLAGMQASSLKAMQSAESRSRASLQIQDIIDRMRANRRPADEGAYDLALGDAPAAGDAVAAEDLRQWKAALGRALPDGDGSIERSASAAEREHCGRTENCFYWITVQWTALGEDGAADALHSASGSEQRDEARSRILQRHTQQVIVVAVL